MSHFVLLSLELINFTPVESDGDCLDRLGPKRSPVSARWLLKPWLTSLRQSTIRAGPSGCSAIPVCRSGREIKGCVRQGLGDLLPAVDMGQLSYCLMLSYLDSPGRGGGCSDESPVTVNCDLLICPVCVHLSERRQVLSVKW